MTWPYSKLVETSQKHRLFGQLSFIQRSYVVIIIIDRHMLSVRKCMCEHAHTEELEVPEVLMANRAQGKQCKANSVCLKAVCG